MGIDEGIDVFEGHSNAMSLKFGGRIIYLTQRTEIPLPSSLGIWLGLLQLEVHLTQ